MNVNWHWHRRKNLMPNFVPCWKNGKCHLCHILQILQDDLHLRWRKSEWLKGKFLLDFHPSNQYSYIHLRKTMEFKYLLLNLRRFHWHLFLAHNFSLPVERDFWLFHRDQIMIPRQIMAPDKSTRITGHTIQTRALRNRILAPWNFTDKVLNEETRCISELIKETNTCTFIYKNGKGDRVKHYFNYFYLLLYLEQ